jgi:hypothetical protein
VIHWKTKKKEKENCSAVRREKPGEVGDRERESAVFRQRLLCCDVTVGRTEDWKKHAPYRAALPSIPAQSSPLPSLSPLQTPQFIYQSFKFGPHSELERAVSGQRPPLNYLFYLKTKHVYLNCTSL